MSSTTSRKGSGSGSITCTADGERTLESYLWDDLPAPIRDALLAAGELEDAASHKPPLVVLVKPSGRHGWHCVLPTPVLRALSDAYDADVVVSRIDGRTARVWFDRVGITL